MSVEKKKVDINKIVKEIEKKHEELKVQVQDLLKDLYAEFFTQFPEFHAITWTQFTPHFNDGDECVFSVHELFAVKTEEALEDFNGYEVEDEQGIDTYGSSEASKALSAIGSLLSSHDDVAKAAYGDHVQVVIKSNGEVLTNDYDHD